jgi:GNAT superfamily N-acetyltransferase
VKPDELACLLSVSEAQAYLVLSTVTAVAAAWAQVQSHEEAGTLSGSVGLFSIVPKSPRRRLVGFACAHGDEALVAVISQLFVLPSHRHKGVGTRLIETVVAQLRSRGIYDIGVAAHTSVRPFFAQASFADDSQGALYMALPSDRIESLRAQQTHDGDQQRPAEK